MMYRIKNVSEISGVSVRTLHHYDEIGLLKPQKEENGYRYYTDEDLSVLQTILFYKYLGFSLKQIKGLLDQEDTRLIQHFKKQLNLMIDEKKRLLTLIDTLEKTIESSERRVAMSTKEKFKGFAYKDNEKYKEIAIDLYGKKVIEEAVKRQEGKEQEVADGFNQIFFNLSENMSKGILATDAKNVVLAKSLHEHICRYAFDCSNEVFSGLGYGYVKNPEFKANIDKFGEGTAQYTCDAIQAYVANCLGETI